MRLALIAAAGVALTIGSTASSPASDGWGALHRPLRLKPLTAIGTNIIVIRA